jgi:hypothetical protein
MNKLREMRAHLRRHWYFWLPVFLIVGFILRAILDRRVYFELVGENVSKKLIENSTVYFGKVETGFGFLRYGSYSNISGFFEAPPKIVRVVWDDGVKTTDRTVPVEGKRVSSESYLYAAQLLIEFDPDCGKARASWTQNYAGEATPLDYRPRDCRIYKDWATPADAKPQLKPDR